MSKTITIKQSILAIISLILIYTLFFQFLDLSIDTWANVFFKDSLAFKLSLLIDKIFAPATFAAIAILLIVFGLIKSKTPLAKHCLMVGGSILLALVIAEFFKVILARYRPIEWFMHQFYGFHFFSTHHNFNGTPSGHTTATFAAFYAICYLRQKKGLTILLMSIATLVGLSRIVIVDHYPSDIIFGAYLGILSVYWFAALKSKFCPSCKHTSP